MQKIYLIFLLVLGLALCSAAAFAQDPQGGQGQCQMMGQGGMMGQQGPMMQQMQAKRGMMQPKSMVATGDGGIVVLSGDSLLKYDQDLNLLKEVKIKSDLPQMENMPPASMNEMPASTPTEQTQQ